MASKFWLDYRGPGFDEQENLPLLWIMVNAYLTPEQGKLLRLRYRHDGSVAYSLREMGILLHKSHSVVGKSCNVALRKLRAAHRLAEFFEKEAHD